MKQSGIGGDVHQHWKIKYDSTTVRLTMF